MNYCTELKRDDLRDKRTNFLSHMFPCVIQVDHSVQGMGFGDDASCDGVQMSTPW